MDNFLENVGKVKVPAEISKAALEPPAKEIGQGFGNLFNLIFAPLEKARIKKDHEIMMFKKELEKNIDLIPAENLVEAPLNIVGPSLEAAKFYIEDNEIRNMFAKLIASSMDVTQQTSTHPSFVEIIKQMSPFDAMILKYLYNNKSRVGSAMICISSPNDKSGGYKIIVRIFFPFDGITTQNFQKYVASVDNLIRLGILVIDEDSRFVDAAVYDDIESHPFYLDFKREVEGEHDVVLKYTFWEFTNLGRNFCKCCI